MTMFKPYYKNNQVTLYHGDCMEILPELQITFDCCITDLPYGTTSFKWDRVIPFAPMWEQLKRLVKPKGAICLFGAEPFSSTLRLSNLEMFKYDWIYIKNNVAGFVNAKLKPMNKHEIISVFSQGKTSNGNDNNMVYYPQGLRHYGKYNTGGGGNYKRPSHHAHIQQYTNYPNTVLQFSRPSKTKHSTQKPTELLEYLINTYTNEGETVLDFTCGSGSTGVACMNINRKCVLIEKEEKYCEISAKRLEDARGLFTEI